MLGLQELQADGLEARTLDESTEKVMPSLWTLTAHSGSGQQLVVPVETQVYTLIPACLSAPLCRVRALKCLGPESLLIST